ncbi:hypothetical protein V7S43_013141 [Phytophthora oleae]|uniref:Uncharacterized protein n=1 Tax=Phytophthora oleae TaxID=2107226 RepID=A0ABD3F4U8_9STRA
MYNCTSAANLWNLQDDPNVLRLENFQQLSANASDDTSMPGNVTEEVREIVAIASVEFSNCARVRKTAVGRPVLGNAFFSADFSSNPAFFYTVSSSDTYTSGSGNCLLRLEMARANLTEVYPNCKISFQSTDFNNVIHSNDVTASSAEGSKTRRLEMGTYTFVKDPLCSYECGVDVDPDECLVDLGDNEYVTMECWLQFFEQNPNCNSEWGDDVGALRASADQCYQCEQDVWDGCDSGYYRADWHTCCTPLTCDPVEDTTVETLTGLTWNLKSDGTFINPSYVIYQGGDCSDPYDLSITCCRITCENCFVSLSLASFYADVDANGIADYSTTAEMKLTGSSVLWVKVFAPSGCTFESTNNIIDKSASMPMGYGVSAKINMKLDILKRLTLKPHGTSAEFGAITEITDITTGYIDSKQFFDVEMNTIPISLLDQSGIDIELEVAAIPTITATISLLAGVAKVGVKTTCSIFTKLKTGVKYPEPYPALLSRNLDPNSTLHFGYCNLPHFLEFNAYAGYKDFIVSLPMEFGVNYVYSKTFESKMDLDISMSKSLFSGCIATAYDAQMLLSTALATVSSLSADKQKKLKKVLMWALGITEIDPDYLSINSISTSTGEISIRITVPPSVADDYPTASKFQEVIYQRARTKGFSEAFSAYVGLEMNAQCNAGSWGPTCENACDLGNCVIAKCNPVDGATTSCSSCKDGY